MTNTFSILFYLRKDKSTDNKITAPIYCRITINGKRSEFSIKRQVPINLWVSGKESVFGRNDLAKTTNNYLFQIKGKLQEFYGRLQRDEKIISAKILKDIYFGLDKKVFSLLKLFRDHNQQMKELIGLNCALGTFKRYETTYSHLEKYISLKYKKTDYNVREINFDFVTGFDHYLRVEHKCNNNSTVKYVKNFQKIVNLAKSKGLITIDPFISYKPKLGRVDRGYLTEVELNKIIQKDIVIGRLKQVRDMFLFQCYTGLSFIDVKNLKRSAIVSGDDGKPWIKTFREKTKTAVNVPLFQAALRIIESYANHPDCIKNNTVLPVISNQKVNAYLKELADICGIDKNISSHLARHTFATTVTLLNGVSLESVSDMLGHKNIATTKIYARMMSDRVSREMEVIAHKFE